MTTSTALRSLRSSLSQSHLAIRQFHSTPSWAEQFLDANAETFERVALDPAAKEKVVLVDFYADWCLPCRTLSPILHRLTEDMSVRTGSGSSLDLVTVNTDQQQELAMQYQIRSLPTVIAFKEGKPIDKFIGALNEAGVRQFLKNVLDGVYMAHTSNGYDNNTKKM